MDVQTFLKKATTDELLDLRKDLENEINSRKAAAAPARGQKKVITFTDGASRGNPGPAGVGVLLFDESGEKITQDFQFLGETTNNEAEYRALLLALDRAREVTNGVVECYLDSELTVRQLNGVYQLKSEKLRKFYDEVKERVQRFASVTFQHVPREHPKLQLADKLANRAIDEARPPRRTSLQP